MVNPQIPSNDLLNMKDESKDIDSSEDDTMDDISDENGSDLDDPLTPAEIERKNAPRMIFDEIRLKQLWKLHKSLSKSELLVCFGSEIERKKIELLDLDSSIITNVQLSMGDNFCIVSSKKPYCIGGAELSKTISNPQEVTLICPIEIILIKTLNHRNYGLGIDQSGMFFGVSLKEDKKIL